MLTVSIRHPLGRIDLQVAFTATDGLTALVGPSGAGKTSVLDAVAGLLRPADGRISLNGDLLIDTASGTCRRTVAGWAT
jgi:molybdate transport system ATP-binding protein